MHDNTQPLETKIYTHVLDSLREEWQQLWSESSMKNFFNSPLWFDATVATFRYQTICIVTIYRGNTLVGILPLVKTKKYGIATYTTPGSQYYDNSSLLVIDNNQVVIETLLKVLSEHGNYYLSEVSEQIMDIVKTSIPKVGISKTSICPYLELQSDPYRFISKKNRRLLRQRLNKAEGHISLKIYHEHAGEEIPTMLAIDNNSSKRSELKQTFSDPLLQKLLEKVHASNNQALIIAILYYKNEPICYNFGFFYDRTYISSGTAYTAEYNYLAPGKLLVYFMLPEFIKMGIQICDLSRGYSRYKTEFTPVAYQQYALFYSHTPFVMGYWKMMDGFKQTLERYPRLYEAVRKTKHQLFFSSFPFFSKHG